MIRFRFGNLHESEVVKMFTKYETRGESSKINRTMYVCEWKIRMCEIIIIIKCVKPIESVFYLCWFHGSFKINVYYLAYTM